MSSGSRKKRQSVGQTVGGVLFGFEQQVLRNAPPPEELVHHARPNAPVAAPDGDLLTLDVPDAPELDDPWAGIEDELQEHDPWAEYAAEVVPEGDAPAEPQGQPAADEDARAPRPKVEGS